MLNCVTCGEPSVLGGTCFVCRQRRRNKHTKSANAAISAWLDAIIARQEAEKSSPPPTRANSGPADDGADGPGFDVSVRGSDGKTQTFRVSAGPDTEFSWLRGCDDATDGTQCHTFSFTFKQRAFNRDQRNAEPGECWPVFKCGRCGFLEGWSARHGGSYVGCQCDTRDASPWFEDDILRQEQASIGSAKSRTINSEIQSGTIEGK